MDDDDRSVRRRRHFVFVFVFVFVRVCFLALFIAKVLSLFCIYSFGLYYNKFYQHNSVSLLSLCSLSLSAPSTLSLLLSLLLSLFLSLFFYVCINLRQVDREVHDVRR